MSLDFKLDTASLTGADEIMKKLEEKFNERRVASIVNSSLNEAADKYTEGLAMSIASYADTGATVSETTRSRASKKASGMRTVRVGWNGPMKRYKLIHLNEFGYTRWGKTYSPRGSGVIQGYIDNAGPIFYSDVLANMKKLVE